MALFRLPGIRSLGGLRKREDEEFPLTNPMPMPGDENEKRGSFFDTGKLQGKDWLGLVLGGIGDALAQQNGGQAMITPMVMNSIMGARQAAQAQAAAQAKRKNDWTDWVRKEQWKLDNPSSANNDTVNDYNFYREQMGPEAANQWLQNQIDPITTIPLPGNRTYIGPRSGIPGQSSAGEWETVPDDQVPDDVKNRLRGGAGSGPRSFRRPYGF